MRPSKVIANAFSAASHRVTHRAPRRPVGTSVRVTRQRHLGAAPPFGNCPPARTARRLGALRDTIALAVQMILRISAS